MCWREVDRESRRIAKALEARGAAGDTSRLEAVAHVLLYSLLTVEDAWMRYGRVPHEFANELWPLARPREPT